MKYKVKLDGDINFAPSTEVEEILQNVRTILATCFGTVPLDREMGLSWEHIDKPLPVAKALMQATIVETLEDKEPRARIVSIDFDDNTVDAMAGILRPSVIVSIGDEEDEE